MSQETISQNQEFGTVAGKADSVHDQSSDEWFGISIDETWYNGNGSTDVEKGDTVELKVNDSEDFIDIESVKILRESDQDNNLEGSSNSSAQNKKGVGQSSPTHISKTNRIVAQGAVKIAVHNADTDYSEDPQEHIEEVKKRSKEYSGLIENLGKQLEQQGGGQ